MTDYLMVHGAGQGAWSWGKVWGYLTAPVEHPPRLYVPRRANRVYPMDLPGHGTDAGGDTSLVRLDECVHAVIRAVEREGLSDLVMVGHGFAGSLVMQAAGQLSPPPKRVVLVAGIVPFGRRTILSACSRRTRIGFSVLSALSNVSRQDMKMPKAAVSGYLCNGMDPMDVVRLMGFLGPLPTRVLKTKVPMEESLPEFPITYVVLTQDRLVPRDQQMRIANRFSGVELIEIESCHQVVTLKPRELADVLLKYA